MNNNDSFQATASVIRRTLAEAAAEFSVPFDTSTGQIAERPFTLTGSMAISALAILIMTKFMDGFVSELGKTLAQKTGTKVDRGFEAIVRRIREWNRAQESNSRASERDVSGLEEIIENRALHLQEFSRHEIEDAGRRSGEVIVVLLVNSGLRPSRAAQLAEEMTTLLSAAILTHWRAPSPRTPRSGLRRLF